MTTPTSFDGLRMWEGSQHRAFEELTYQLLRESVPAGTRAIRTGNPDGGVEWYVTKSDGSQSGWQAKYIKDIGSLLTAMTDSVRRVTTERPTLNRLVFVIPENLATGTSGRERKSQRQKYDDKVAVWKHSIKGAAKIDFELVQGSDLLTVLAQAEHRGRRWFWWGGLTLGANWLAQRHAEQAEAAGDKYRPDLQVDIPIQDDLLALGFDRSVRDDFERRCRVVRAAVDDLHVRGEGRDKAATLNRTLRTKAEALRTVCEGLVVEAGDPPSALEPLDKAMDESMSAVWAAQRHEQELEETRNALDEAQRRTQPEAPKIARGYDVRALTDAVDDVQQWLNSYVGLAWRQRAYLLIGQAGSGKTHLFLDATRRALDADRPAVFLAGARFGRGDLWASVTDQLGLEPVGADVLLGAMEAAGQATSLVGSRFVVFVDALNETPTPDFWLTYLPALRAAVARHPHVALAVSCRDSYEDGVLEVGESQRYVRRTHPGFVDREVEATQRYFDHYKLEAPKIPLLTPEFSLPLFLRLFCESMTGLSGTQIPSGHQGRIEIFERYLAAKTKTVARRLRPNATTSYQRQNSVKKVAKVIDGLLDEMTQSGREGLRADVAEARATAELSGSNDDAVAVIGLLQDEGVLTRERLYLDDGGYADGVRIVFQAFSDFLVLRHRFAATPEPQTDDGLTSWLANDSTWGVLEAATVYVPEQLGVELPDFLGLAFPSRRRPRDESEKAWRRRNRVEQIYTSLVRSLPFRDATAITKRTIELLNLVLPSFSTSEFYGLLFTMAPQPANPLNGEGLHNHLSRLVMPRRDASFGFATYHELQDPYSAASRLARWAANGPYPTYDPDVIELACIPLCWLLSSPNRFMRDWVTKALVQLLRGHLDVMARLVERFWTVDDPYVVQRIVAIAYGAVLRSTPNTADSARELAVIIHRLIFTRPIRADELLLDAGRGVVRWAVGHGLLEDSALDAARRPYGLTAPGPAPSEETIQRKYGWRQEQPDNESYAGIRLSLLTMGDFARYVVESGLHHFSRYKFGEPYPPRRSRRMSIVKRRWAAFLASLPKGDQQLAAQRADQEDFAWKLWINRSQLHDDLSEEQRALLEAVFVFRKPVNDEYPADRACRWIFQRTMSLGWTPALFGVEDRNLGHDRVGRESHKAERWGKKYQWMAYHELLARVADNYQSARRYDGDLAYEGLHQIIAEREIDPSLPPINFRSFNESGGQDTASWEPPPIELDVWPPARIDFDRYYGDIRAFTSDPSGEPTLRDLIMVKDITGEDWIVLESFLLQVDPKSSKSWRGIQQASKTHSAFVTKRDVQKAQSALASQPSYDFHSRLGGNEHIDCCYVGEVGRIGPLCPSRQVDLHPVEMGDVPVVAVSAVEEYSWEGNILDCSIGESARAVLPSTFVQMAAELSFDMRGPSWTDINGNPVFVYCAEPGASSFALVVRASFLRDFMRAHDVELVVTAWFERMIIDGDHQARHPYAESNSEGRIAADLRLHTSVPRRATRNLEV